MKINFLLTAFSPAMIGEKATVHFQVLSLDEAQSLVGPDTRLLATRIPHERLARGLFPNLSQELARFVSLVDGVNAIFIQYKGPQISDDGRLPPGATVVPYLIEVEEYQCAGT